MDHETLKHQINQAVMAHAKWKRTLSDAVQSGQLPKPSADIFCDDQCGFGKWLHIIKTDSEVAGSPAFQRVMQAHVAFHMAAGEVARLVEKGQKTQAQQALSHGAFVTSTFELNSAMSAWEGSI